MHGLRSTRKTHEVVPYSARSVAAESLTAGRKPKQGGTRYKQYRGNVVHGGVNIGPTATTTACRYGGFLSRFVTMTEAVLCNNWCSLTLTDYQ